MGPRAGCRRLPHLRPGTDRYGTSPEQALAFDPHGPVNLAAMFNLSVQVVGGWERLEQAVRTGRGIGYAEQSDGVICGITEYLRSGYVTNLLGAWIPAMPGVPERLTAGARVADVGRARRHHRRVMAQRYPASRFHGFDYDRGSVEHARVAAAEAGVGDRVSFEVSDAAQIPALGYDLVTTFDALYDYGHPQAAARRVRESLRPGGTG